MDEEKPPLRARPSLTLRDLNIDADSDAESISVDGADKTDPLANRVENDSVASDSDAGSRDDGEILGSSAHERFVEYLKAQGISENIDTSGMEEFHRRLSEVSFSDKSYILDLGRQQVSREETIRKEAFEDAHIWYGKALIRGMPESKELFGNIYQQLIEETRGRYAEFHKKQDEWLNQALDEYQQKMSAEELEKLQKKAPTDDDLKKKKLAKKISKTQKLMKKALKNEGKDSETYRNYEKKLAEYQAQSEKQDGTETKPKRKSKEKNGTKKKNKDDASTRSRKSNLKKLKGKRSSSKKLEVDDDNTEISKAQSTRSLRSGKKKSKEKREKRGGKKSPSFRSTRSILSSGGEEDKKHSSLKTLKKKKKKESPRKQKSMPNLGTDSEDDKPLD